MSFSAEEARRFYDKFGSKQDKQAFYEDAAMSRLREHGAFDRAANVLEFGCGTGRFASNLFRDNLSPTCTYTGIDVSSTMIELSRNRLASFSQRSALIRTENGIRAAADRGPFDRIVSNYVLDILSGDDCRSFVRTSFELMSEDGFLCLVSLTHGFTIASRLVTGVWKTFHSVRPSLVGGCRPISLLSLLGPEPWEIEYSDRVSQWGVPSEILIARKPSGPRS
jgi:SAM-dependent methyltransferase